MGNVAASFTGLPAAGAMCWIYVRSDKNGDGNSMPWDGSGKQVSFFHSKRVRGTVFYVTHRP